MRGYIGFIGGYVGLRVQGSRNLLLWKVRDMLISTDMCKQMRSISIIESILLILLGRVKVIVFSAITGMSNDISSIWVIVKIMVFFLVIFGTLL